MGPDPLGRCPYENGTWAQTGTRGDGHVNMKAEARAPQCQAPLGTGRQRQTPGRGGQVCMSPQPQEGELSEAPRLVGEGA